MEKFSVSMCVYHKDNPQWFAQAVKSVLEQTLPPDELIIVVDGPVPDSLEEVLATFSPCAHIIRLRENRGHGEARRTGLLHCTHELVAIMDADDICQPNRFALQMEAFAKDPTLSVVGGQIGEFIHSPEEMVGYRQVPLSPEEIRKDLKTRCPMNQMTVMFRKSHVQQVGGYLDWYCNEDYYLWVRMQEANMRFANVPQVLVKVRVGEQMYRRRGGWKYFRSEQKLQAYMRQKGLIGWGTYIINVAKRLVVQVLLPNRLRSWVFQKFARKQTSTGQDL